MLPLKLSDVAQATGGRLVQGGPGTLITSVSTDTRTIEPGALFVPIVGERFDGHEFIEQAAAKGASAVIFSGSRFAARRLPDSFAAVEVQDTLLALQQLALWHRAQFQGPVVAVTGSNGKTTTKDMIAAVLARRFSVLSTHGNLNTEIGMAMTLLRRDPTHTAIVVEMGMRGSGQIASLMKIARPSIGVVTNVGPVHLELLGTVEAVARAKRELVEDLPANGTAVLNADDPLVIGMKNKTKASLLTYGIVNEADIAATGLRSLGMSGYEFRLAAGGESIMVRLPLPGRHNVSNALAAAAVGVQCGLRLTEIAQGLAEMRPSGMRMQVEHFPGDVVIVNDAYNASPASMRASLDVLVDLPATRRIAVLGDMLELGSISQDEHYAIGQLCAEHQVDILVSVGERARDIANGARDHERSSVSIIEVPDADRAGEVLLDQLRPGDVVLVKASRGIELEHTIEAVRRGLEERK